MRSLDTYLTDNIAYEKLLTNPKHLKWFYKAYKAEAFKVNTAILKELFLPLDKKILTEGTNKEAMTEIVDLLGSEEAYDEVYNINTNTFSINFEPHSFLFPALSEKIFYIKDFINRQGNPILHDFLLRLITESFLLSPSSGKSSSVYMDRVKQRLSSILKKKISFSNFHLFYEGYLIREVITKSRTNDSLINSLVNNEKWNDVENLFKAIEKTRYYCLEQETLLSSYLLDTANSKYQMEKIVSLMKNHPVLEKMISSLIP